MYKNIYFPKEVWELFESLRKHSGLSRGDFIKRILMAYLSSVAEGATNEAE